MCLWGRIAQLAMAMAVGRGDWDRVGCPRAPEHALEGAILMRTTNCWGFWLTQNQRRLSRNWWSRVTLYQGPSDLWPVDSPRSARSRCRAGPEIDSVSQGRAANDASLQSTPVKSTESRRARSAQDR